ncbi:MAG TPA: hypothetical protein VD866_32080 [Urbifossiella sp.]|nr:hypothetical protein [Urbifossiella sp.]
MTQPDPGPPLIPIVLGVVGHRDLRAEDEEDLRDALKKVFQEFDDAYPKSPKVLLSPLAPGADQLAAEVALAQGPNWSVRAPLALPPEHFVRSTAFRLAHLTSSENADGTDARALAAFEKFLADPRVEWFVVPLPGELSVAGRTARRHPDGWRLSLPDGKEEELDWEAMLTASKETHPALAAFRAACYANPGGYIVRHCHTLIALWDGHNVERPSGTPEVVRFQLGGIAPSYYPWTALTPLGFDAERGPVIWLRTPRTGAAAEGVVGERRVLVPTQADKLYFGERVDVPAVARKLTRWERFRGRCALAVAKREPPAPLPASAPTPGPWEPARLRTHCPEYNQFFAACQMIEDFNVEASRVYAARAADADYVKRLKKADAETATVFPGSSAIPAAKVPLGDSFRRFLRVRETAAHLAGPLAARHELAGWGLFALTFFALLAFHLYAHPLWHGDPATPPHHPWLLLALFAALWLGLIALVVGVWHSRVDDRRHDYRALAEALRVRQVYAAAGLSRSVADTYLGQLRTELAWVRRALLHVCPPADFWAEQFNSLPEAEQLDRIRWVETNWVAGQAEQHRRRRDDKHKEAGRYRTWGLCLALGGLVLLAVVPLAALVWAEAGGAAAADWVSRTLHPSHPPNLLLVLGSMLIILGGLLVAWCDWRGHEQLSKQYDHMYVIFRGGGRELTAALNPHTLPPPHPTSAAPDVARAQRVIEELGREAVQENAQWLLLLRSKPLELPLGA